MRGRPARATAHRRILDDHCRIIEWLPRGVQARVQAVSSLAHFAINADDVSRARSFYEAVFGWSFSAWGPPEFYQIDTGADSPVRGALQKRRNLAAEERTIGFECTLSVDDLDAVEKAVLGNGGTIALPRSVIGGVGTLMFFRDTEGNVFGAMQYDASAT